jgi:hypothetical protein
MVAAGSRSKQRGEGRRIEAARELSFGRGDGGTVAHRAGVKLREEKRRERASELWRWRWRWRWRACCAEDEKTEMEKKRRNPR